LAYNRHVIDQPARGPTVGASCLQPGLGLRLPGPVAIDAYDVYMSVMRDELHHLIDQLPEEQVAPMLTLVRESLPEADDGETLWPLPSFVGTLASGQGDIAARSQDILREEMGRDIR
jgi:hypothetical protein